MCWEICQSVAFVQYGRCSIGMYTEYFLSHLSQPIELNFQFKVQVRKCQRRGNISTLYNQCLNS
jgi:hypothetical protein